MRLYQLICTKWLSITGEKMKSDCGLKYVLQKLIMPYHAINYIGNLLAWSKPS